MRGVFHFFPSFFAFAFHVQRNDKTRILNLEIGKSKYCIWSLDQSEFSSYLIGHGHINQSWGNITPISFYLVVLLPSGILHPCYRNRIYTILDQLITFLPVFWVPVPYYYVLYIYWTYGCHYQERERSMVCRPVLVGCSAEIVRK